MKKKIRINHDSIKNELSSYKDRPERAILEYIWNGFDANANAIQVKYKFNGEEGFGYPDLEIIDDGDGWNFEVEKKMGIFLASEKDSEKSRSLPHGSKGVGRCTFYSFANEALWETIFNGKGYVFKLTSDALDKYETISQKVNLQKGTRVSFKISSEELTESFFENELIEAIKLEFAWFLKLFPAKKILINEKEIKISNLIEKQRKDIINIDGQTFSVEYIQWTTKLSGESSKYYFCTENGQEKRKQTTRLNNKSDVFYHSVYIRSEFFQDFYPVEDEGDIDGQLPLDKDGKKIYKELMQKIKGELINLRKEYLINYSKEIIENWKEKDILPKKEELFIEEKEYEEIIKEMYIIAPQLFTNSSDDQRRVILKLIASLLGTEEKNYILKILEQVYGLSEEDKESLIGLLGRTTISNIIKTVQEIDHRLEVLNSLEEILFDHEKRLATKEVEHLQKILDKDFWVFGEQYRLFASTEGSIKKTLERFKNEILRKDDEKIETESRKELDLFLTKQDITGSKTNSIIVEIKRPSTTLGKNEYDQIQKYMETIIKEPACNGENIEWVFYLIGNDYNEHIKDLIENAQNWGEKDKGLVYKNIQKKVSIYVRKWSDIINVEQKSKYSYLKEKLQIESKPLKEKTSKEIVEDITKQG